jgi:DNA invertase Pin-like site-specific DNA recombinase
MVACKPNKLARSATDILPIADGLHGPGVGLIMLSMGGQRIDTRTCWGHREFERSLLSGWQRERVTNARADGKYKGRKPTARVKVAEVVNLEGEGLQRTEVAKRTGISVAAVRVRCGCEVVVCGCYAP